MSAWAIAFMLLTMGGVVALNVLCILAWMRGARRAPADVAPREPGPPRP